MRNERPRQGVARLSGSQQKLGERHRENSPSEPHEGTKPARALFGLLSTRTVSGYTVSVVLSYQNSRHLLRQLWKTDLPFQGVS